MRQLPSTLAGLDKGCCLKRFLLVAMLVLVVAAGCGGSDDLGGEPIAPDVEVVLAASAEAMAGVESVRFDIERSGAPVFIDEVESIAVDAVTGTVEVPDRAEALLTVTIDGSVTTQLGATPAGRHGNGGDVIPVAAHALGNQVQSGLAAAIGV